MQRYALLLLFVALLGLVSAPPASAAGCPIAPRIGDPVSGIEAFPIVEHDRIAIQYDDRCSNEDYTLIIKRKQVESYWQVLKYDNGVHWGWRTIEHSNLEPETEYCYRVRTKLDGVANDSPQACVTTLREPPRLDLISNSSAACGTPPTNPSATDQREHLFMTQTLALELGLDLAAVQLVGPSPQVRMVVDEPLLTNGDTSTAAYTVARICTGSSERKVWVWTIDRLFPSQAVTLADLELSFEPMAPSRTVDGGVTTHHFGEPSHATSGAKHLRENLTMRAEKRVALLIPHGGGIELNTSRQIDAFVDELEDGTNNVPVNVWEVEGQWGSGETSDRWHITSNDIHPDGFPGLDTLLNEPLFDWTAGQHFQYAVSFHGFDDNSDFGIILGGLADRDLRCHVAATIRAIAGTRGQEIGFHIAQAANGGGDLLLANNRLYVPAPANVQGLEGRSEENIVNWISEAVVGTQTSWGGIQLEQSTCLRRESNCAHGIAACTLDQPECLHNVVAAGVARALEEVLDGTTNPAGACCTHFNQCNP